MKKILLCLSALFLMVSCASTVKQEILPSWVGLTYDNVIRNSSFVAAVGTGATKESAEKNAKLSLSQVFSTSVKSVQKQFISDDFSGITSNYLSNEEYFTQLENMQGLEVHDVYLSKNGTYWVRVVLNKQKTIDNINGGLTSQRNEIKTLVEQSNESGNPFEKYRYLSRALKTAIEMQPTIDQLSVLKGFPQSSPVVTLRDSINQVQKDLTVKFDSTNVPKDLKDRVEAKVGETLQSKGFTINDEATAILTLGYSEKIEERDNLFYCNNNFTYAIKSDGKILSTFTNFSRGVGINKLTASTKALQKSCTALEKEFL